MLVNLLDLGRGTLVVLAFFLVCRSTLGSSEEGGRLPEGCIPKLGEVSLCDTSLVSRDVEKYAIDKLYAELWGAEEKEVDTCAKERANLLEEGKKVHLFVKSAQVSASKEPGGSGRCGEVNSFCQLAGKGGYQLFGSARRKDQTGPGQKGFVNVATRLRSSQLQTWLDGIAIVAVPRLVEAGSTSEGTECYMVYGASLVPRLALAGSGPADGTVEKAGNSGKYKFEKRALLTHKYSRYVQGERLAKIARELKSVRSFQELIFDQMKHEEGTAFKGCTEGVPLDWIKSHWNEEAKAHVPLMDDFVEELIAFWGDLSSTPAAVPPLSSSPPS